MSPVKIKLANPVKFGSETISELEIREPKAKDFRDMPVMNQNVGHFLAIAASLSGHPPSLMDELSFTDMQRVVEVMQNFLEAGPKTGKGA